MIFAKSLFPLLSPSIKRFGQNPSVRQAHEVANVLWSWGDSLLHEVSELAMKDGYSQSCSMGCYYCCHQNVRIDVFEAIAIIDWIRNSSDDALQNDIVSKAEALNAVAEGDTKDSDRWARRDPCPCLDMDSGQCRIYPVRPVECRLGFSHDRGACQKNYFDAGASWTPVDPPENLSVVIQPEAGAFRPSSLSEMVSLSLLVTTSELFLRLLGTKRELDGRYLLPQTNEKIMEPLFFELGRVLSFGLSGDVNQNLKALVRLKPEAVMACKKVTDPIAQ